LRSEAGVILLERLLAIALAGSIAASTMILWQKQQETYFRGSESVQTQQDVRAALERIARDLRQAKSLTTADAGSIVFKSVVDVDPQPDRTFDLGSATGCERLCVRYNLGTGAGPEPIAEGIVTGGLQFTYRDVNGTVLAAVPLSATDRLQVRQVDITLVGQISVADPDPPFTFSTSVKLRNR
jgi:type II secretory pathway component PulJ